MPQPLSVIVKVRSAELGASSILKSAESDESVRLM